MKSEQKFKGASDFEVTVLVTMNVVAQTHTEAGEIAELTAGVLPSIKHQEVEFICAELQGVTYHGSKE